MCVHAGHHRQQIVGGQRTLALGLQARRQLQYPFMRIPQGALSIGDGVGAFEDRVLRRQIGNDCRDDDDFSFRHVPGLRGQLNLAVP
ncbi:hypothetical protein D621_15930 [beta proteobacterium AAP51]|nr:hypothetical protein D621_15930 [beta proteobacterium AAP51]